jgi:hypothetical protein
VVKNQRANKISVVEIRMWYWMCGKTRQDKIRNGNIKERVQVAPIVEKMGKKPMHSGGRFKGVVIVLF